MSSASSHFESHPVEVFARRSRALGHPSGDSRSTVVPSLSGGMTLDDSKAAEAPVMILSCFNVDSTVMARQLVNVREHYYVPPKYELHVPLPGQRHFDAFSSGFGLSIDALESRLKFPLHPVIEACIEGWQISPS
ncbi:hypothetical protein B296_00004174 [Ensete ventricosum]|uniref:Uncharacterized protein n=1 Tax=Ensete ventricosum TaxID=4639 RepID=A0A427BAS0_ENSVE|nr:hypothetical protein B296_00004174 [Ensete ventricosum]